jgi:hypothetical protein
MADVLRSFDEPIRHSSGSYAARVVGRPAADGMWEGWLEFIPLEPGSGDVVVSSVESRQPAREHLEYWATGLSVVYAEGSLDRAAHPLAVRTRIAETPVSDAPAARVITEPVRSTIPGPEPVLDPFDIGRRSLDILAQELSALNRPRLLNIIEAYDLNPGGEDVAWMSDAQLVRFIVVAVDVQLLQRQQ